MHALIADGAVARYPYTGTDLRRDNPGVSFPAGVLSDATLAQWGVLPVADTAPPAHDPNSQRVEQATPELVAGQWVQRWRIVALTPAEVAQRLQALQDEIVAQTQQRLDTFARTRGYDGILSACTYATSAVPKFAAEGQYCVDARDSTWATLYTLLAQVQAGTRPVPSGYADIEPLLPGLAWPT
jgi:hypothetical protein